MSTRIPLTIEGNLTADPDSGVSEKETDWTRLRVAVNDRRLNEQSGQWEDGDTVFHDVVVFGKQARNAAASLRKGDGVLVTGQLRFSNHTDKETGVQRENRQVVADTVAASLKYDEVTVARSPTANGPEAYATGPVAAPEVQSEAWIAR